jgi:hypothetical protein
VECASCHAANDAARRFCRRCGLRLDVPCPACGFANAADDAYCGGCGRRFADGAPAGAAAPGAAVARASSATSPAPSRSEIEEILFAEPPPPDAEPPAEDAPLSQDAIDAMFRGERDGGGAG